MQFAFQLGGAVSLCISQAIFLNSLSSELGSKLSTVSVQATIKAGAATLPALVHSPGEMYMLRLAYQGAIRDVSIFLLVAGGLAFLAAFGFEHKNVRKVEKQRRGCEQQL
jgi:hypothetical protein